MATCVNLIDFEPTFPHLKKSQNECSGKYDVIPKASPGSRIFEFETSNKHIFKKRFTLGTAITTGRLKNTLNRMPAAIAIFHSQF